MKNLKIWMLIKRKIKALKQRLSLLKIHCQHNQKIKLTQSKSIWKNKENNKHKWIDQSGNWLKLKIINHPGNKFWKSIEKAWPGTKSKKFLVQVRGPNRLIDKKNPQLRKKVKKLLQMIKKSTKPTKNSMYKSFLQVEMILWA